MHNIKFMQLLLAIAFVSLLALAGMYTLGIGVPLVIRILGPVVGGG